MKYDSSFRVTSQILNGVDTVNFKYDNDGLLTNVGVMSLAYNLQNGLLTGTSLGNVTTSQTYSTFGELASYAASYSSSPIFQTSYVRDSLGRITTLNEAIQGVSKSMQYSYDPVGRLQNVWRNDTLVSVHSYDANGNRIAHWTPTEIDSGTYDAQDRMLTYGNAQYFYGRNGDLQTKISGTDTAIYTYDAFGNLTQVVMANGDVIQYVVDGQNRRIAKKLNGKIVERWIYSGQLSPIAELDSAGNVIAEFAGSYMIKDGSTYRIIRDHLGSVRLVVDVNSGTVVQRLDYDEFGNITYNSNSDFQPFGYAGGLYDSESRLLRFGVRDYDGITGRWTNKDPIRFEGGSSNLYSYAKQNPISYVDLDGLSCLIFNRAADKLELYDSFGNWLASFNAANNATNPEGNPCEKESHAPAPNGTFVVRPPVKVDENDADAIEQYGPYKFPIGTATDCAGKRGILIHAGRTGYAYPTWGCIRVDEATIYKLYDYNQQDPITEITIENEAGVGSWQTCY